MTMVRRAPVARAGVALAVTAVFAAGCTSGPAGSARPASTTAPTASTAPAAAPAFAADLGPKITALMDELSVPGAIVYVDVPGKGTWLTAFGSSTTEGAPPMSTDNHMRIGSVTKSLTAEVVLQLVDQGAIGLDDPVTKYLPGVPNGENIAIRQLLGMTAGIFNFTEDDYFNLTLDKDPHKPWTPFECIGIGLAHPPYFPPGQGFHYSNTNYEILGVIAERVGKAPLQKLMQDLVFAKLGMRSTSLPVYDDTAIPDPHSQGYMYGTNVEGNVAYNAALAGNKAAAQITVAPGTKPNDVTDLPSNGVASGAAISTIGDMVIWAKALGTGSLLTPATQAARTTFDPRGNYGLGVEKAFGGLIGHNGAVPGFQTFVGYQPEKGATVIVMANLLLAPNTYFGEALPADGIAQLVQQTVLPE
ncbi:serine hydrolase domain-containing protein [Pseudonocardia charpentierae]|uniref:Serine hydrolase domain-containing protein n=1 Tax=Pseudonocardia charpentierae TaxID=3075545 RepID=A0ABU2NEF0_9PSEU|nr:serine hydrolase domain-containing protein [Pseudonocardia sp. DSM 45834]MDT0352340.1 serine hydrolase domain-containing protein [Pseudonocardia sp. DSM 45834]